MRFACGLCVVVIVFTFTTIAAGRNGYFKVNIVKGHKDFSFPVVRKTSRPIAVKRINQFLQLAELEQLIGHKTTDIFANVWRNGETFEGTYYGGKVAMKLRLGSNNPRVFSLGFKQSFCGMTCGQWVTYYNFNSGNGDVIQLKDLFTERGFEEFSQRILRHRGALFRKELRRLSFKEKIDSRDILNCFESDDLHEFLLHDSSITIDGENCLGKYDKFYGLSMTATFRFFEFKRFLNEYGRTVFGKTNDKIENFRSYELPQLFSGTIDDSLPIVLVLHSHYYENRLRGVYAYLKYGEALFLDGTLSNRQLAVTEQLKRLSGKRYVDNGRIEAAFDGKTLNGLWTSFDNARALTLNASKR